MKPRLATSLGALLLLSAQEPATARQERTSDATRTDWEVYSPVICLQAGPVRLHHLLDGPGVLRGTQLDGLGNATAGVHYTWSTDGEYMVAIAGEYSHSALGRPIGTGQVISRLSYHQPADAICSPCSREPLREDSTIYNLRLHLPIKIDEPVRVQELHPGMYLPPSPDAPPHGSVEAQFVVDTTGHALACSWRVLKSTSQGLEAPAREAILHGLFTPARIGEKAVRQLIQQRIIF